MSTTAMNITPLVEHQLQQAVARHQAGRLQEAEPLYRAILQACPSHPDANHNLGVLAMQTQRPAEAMPLFQAALAANPNMRQYWLSYIDALICTGQTDTAQQTLAQARRQGLSDQLLAPLAQRLANLPARMGSFDKKLLKGKSGLPDSRDLNRLVDMFNAGRLAECERLSRELTAHFPKHGFGWKVLGLVLMRQGRAAEALPAMQKTAALFPDEADAHYNHGVALMALGRQADAEAAYRRALRLNPQYVEALGNLGNVLAEQRNFAEVEGCYRKLLQLGVNTAEAHNNLGNVLKEQSRHDEAGASYRRALELKPDYAEAHGNLGAALAAQKRYAEAEVSYRCALELKPDYAEAHGNLGAVLASQERYDEAEASYRCALELKPDYAEAHGNLGAVLASQKRYDEAASSYQRALEIKPDDAETFVGLGNVFESLGRYEDAEIYFRRALDIRPDYAGAHCGLSDALKHQGKPAEASLRRALELEPENCTALEMMGILNYDQGRFDEAEGWFRRALAIEPNLPAAWASLAQLRKMTPEDAAWMDKAEEMVRGELEPETESSLRYAMGKYCDDVKDYDRGFPNYYRANELKKTFGEAYDRQAQAEKFDRIIERYPRTRTHEVKEGSSASMLPLLIVGMPRSGTSLTEQIIASHQATFGAGELKFWSDASHRAGEAPDAAMLRMLAQECLEHLASFSADALRVVDKMPGNFMNVGLIHEVFPHARILHTQRNPIDTCLSIYFQNFNAGHTYANDLGDLTHYYREYHRLMAHWRAVLPPEVFLDVPYDALVEDQEGWSRKIIEFIGLEWDDACLSFHETERKVGTASNWQVRQKIYKSSKERWRNYEKFVGPLLGLLELG